MASITIVFRPSSKIGNHTGSLCIRLIHERKARLLTLPFKIYPNEWDQKDQCIINNLSLESRSKYIESIDKKISEDIDTIHNIIEKLENQGRYHVDDIINQYKLASNNAFLMNYVNKLSEELIKHGQERTARAYCTAARRLITFNKGKDIPLAHINNYLIKDFEDQLRVEGKTPNTIAFYMRNLRAIYNKAISERLLTAKYNSPFCNVFTSVQKTEKRALDLKELGKLYNLTPLSTLEKRKKKFIFEDKYFHKNLDIAKKYFFFCFHARGMCFVDMAYLRKSNIDNGILRYYRKKTGQRIEVKITPIIQQIIDSFSDKVKDSEYVFPIITDPNKSKRLQYESALRKQNKSLKVLAQMAGIRTISTHVARHSWATIAKKQNLPLWVISEGLGHSSEKMTYTYLASFDRTILDQANETIATALNRSINKVMDFR